MGERELVKRVRKRRLPAGDRSQHNERLLTLDDGIGQRSVRGLVSQVFFACEEPEKRSPLQRVVVANSAAQHGISSLQRIKHTTLRDRGNHVERDLGSYMSKRAQMLRNYNTNHFVFSLAISFRARAFIAGVPLRSAFSRKPTTSASIFRLPSARSAIPCNAHVLTMELGSSK